MVAGELGRFGEGQQLGALIVERLLNLPGGPFQRARAGLVTEDFAELLSLGAELGDALLNGTLFRDQETHTPRRVCLFGGCCGCVLVILCAASGKVKVVEALPSASGPNCRKCERACRKNALSSV